MRLSSSSAEIATASTSRSLRSAKFFTAKAPVFFRLSDFRIILNSRGGWRAGQSSDVARLAQEREQEAADFAGLLLLHPMAGAIDQMAADHLGAGLRLHRLKHAGALIGAPILFAGDEGGGRIDGAAGPGLQLRGERGRRAAAIPLQPALE